MKEDNILNKKEDNTKDEVTTKELDNLSSKNEPENKKIEENENLTKNESQNKKISDFEENHEPNTSIVLRPDSESKSWNTFNSSNTLQSSSGQRTTIPGAVGLSNLGNTCFMNSALQCLSHALPLTAHMLSLSWLKDVNEKNVLGCGGKMAGSYYSFLKKIWKDDNRTVSPSDLKTVIGHFAPQFMGYQQHDSQELLTFLLDGLHEDLNRVLNKPYVEMTEATGNNDAENAANAWSKHLLRNKSFVVDYFEGQLKSTIDCPVCKKRSVTFDPFSVLPLPLPGERTMKMDIIFLPDNSLDMKSVKERLKKYPTCVYSLFPGYITSTHRRPISFVLEIPKFSSIEDIAKKLSPLVGVEKEKLVGCEVSFGRVWKWYGLKDEAIAIHQKRITVVEVDGLSVWSSKMQTMAAAATDSSASAGTGAKKSEYNWSGGWTNGGYTNSNNNNEEEDKSAEKPNEDSDKTESDGNADSTETKPKTKEEEEAEMKAEEEKLKKEEEEAERKKQAEEEEKNRKAEEAKQYEHEHDLLNLRLSVSSVSRSAYSSYYPYSTHLRGGPIVASVRVHHNTPWDVQNRVWNAMKSQLDPVALKIWMEKRAEVDRKEKEEIVVSEVKKDAEAETEAKAMEEKSEEKSEQEKKEGAEPDDAKKPEKGSEQTSSEASASCSSHYVEPLFGEDGSFYDNDYAGNYYGERMPDGRRKPWYQCYNDDYLTTDDECEREFFESVCDGRDRVGAYAEVAPNIWKRKMIDAAAEKKKEKEEEAKRKAKEAERAVEAANRKEEDPDDINDDDLLTQEEIQELCFKFADELSESSSWSEKIEEIKKEKREKLRAERLAKEKEKEKEKEEKEIDPEKEEKERKEREKKEKKEREEREEKERKEAEEKRKAEEAELKKRNEEKEYTDLLPEYQKLSAWLADLPLPSRAFLPYRLVYHRPDISKALVEVSFNKEITFAEELPDDIEELTVVALNLKCFDFEKAIDVVADETKKDEIAAKEGTSSSFSSSSSSSSSSSQSPNARKKKLTLKDCLELFTSPEELTEDNMYYCNRCKEFRQGMKQMEVWRLPPLLVMQFKRFSSGKSILSAQKVTGMIEYPVDALDLTWVEQCGDGERAEMMNVLRERYPELVFKRGQSGNECSSSSSSSSSSLPSSSTNTSTNSPSPAIYDLFGVSMHSGWTSGGHYTAYALCPMTGRWMNFNDSYVSDVVNEGERQQIKERTRERMRREKKEELRLEREKNGGKEEDWMTEEEQMIIDENELEEKANNEIAETEKKRVIDENAYMLFYKRRGVDWSADALMQAIQEGIEKERLLKQRKEKRDRKKLLLQKKEDAEKAKEAKEAKEDSHGEMDEQHMDAEQTTEKEGNKDGTAEIAKGDDSNKDANKELISGEEIKNIENELEQLNSEDLDVRFPFENERIDFYDLIDTTSIEQEEKEKEEKKRRSYYSWSSYYSSPLTSYYSSGDSSSMDDPD
ncbi:putative Ubiquitin carboxylterminal hydrolase 15 [Monocercomonoides exilis]|uniref:putative Ubiquitin carboxylterminal hydrolase 15 n=1 Tax=Monocercomonoides exilis TaxID=2049356 RepID=UPI00355A0E46|nr:putative Ubiquitin carboxylterminal hydrolase 15 [Monocercomonoides exilis]|eukprot:MONOS_4254.1-p1 / transcript=MONOS_4254.1 / gene=MONOS_4254 / organism=Monocercomonoides_exilis_PA203 / gene_product=Ubiquitin carboxylterminal hydrolase 15, putative / transcript_product=Ubiquitin carboxylterminal hydrolase 15, putative / location=Mono_scaffold00111:5663-10576(+) / protein_length=1461 / sequence_SO=supercontig / SO=protein_coding / is_pseudo=false